jgi:hypothetical protein
MPWLGRKKIAFIPLHRPNAHPPDDAIPADWPAETLRRVYYDPERTSWLAGSFSAHVYPLCLIGAGRLDATVWLMEIPDDCQSHR